MNINVLTLKEFLCLLSAICYGFIFSSQATSFPDSYQQCVACHGEKGEGNIVLNAPMLAGQSQEYLSRQLQHFKSGIRGSHEKDLLGKQMSMVMQQLDINKDVPALTQYLSAQPPVNAINKTSGDLKNGSRYYQAKCGACHGGKAEGNPAFKAPKLAGLDSDYLQRQMANFVNGVRGFDAKDKYGRQMAMMARTSSGDELRDIIHFIANQ